MSYWVEQIPPSAGYGQFALTKKVLEVIRYNHWTGHALVRRENVGSPTWVPMNKITIY